MNTNTSNTQKITGYRTGVRRLDRVAGIIKREYLDHFTGFLTVPVVIAALFFVFVAGSLVFGGHPTINADGTTIVIGGDEIDDFDDFAQDENNLRKLAAVTLAGLGLPIYFVVPFVVVFGLLSTLFDDRRDKSILFWRSMPVSDTQEVLLKFLTITLLGPIGIFLITLLYQVIMALVIGIGLAIYTPFGLFDLLVYAPFFSGFAGLVTVYIAYILSALPVLGYLMAVSAFAPKAPLLMAGLPIVVISLLENIVFRSGYFIGYVADSLWMGDGSERLFRQVGRELGGPFRDFDEGALHIVEPAFTLLFAVIGRVEFLAGLLIGGAFIALAIWKRGKAI